MAADSKELFNQLMTAVKSGNKEEVIKLLKAGTDANKDSPLYHAAFRGHTEIAEVLLAHGADIHAKFNGEPPLYIASRNGHTKTVNLLLNQGANVNEAKFNGETPLYIASKHGYIDIANLLLAHKADVNATDRLNRAPLHGAAYNGQSIELAKALLTRGAMINRADEYGETALHWAVEGGHIDIVDLLVTNGADPRLASKTGWTPVALASEEIYSLLIDKCKILEQKETGQSYIPPIHLRTSSPIHAGEAAARRILSTAQEQQKDKEKRKPLRCSPG